MTIAPTPPAAINTKTIEVCTTVYPESLKYRVKNGTTKVPKR